MSGIWIQCDKCKHNNRYYTENFTIVDGKLNALKDVHCQKCNNTIRRWTR